MKTGQPPPPARHATNGRNTVTPEDHAERHPGTRQIARWFSYSHLINSEAYKISRECHGLAEAMIGELPDGPELTAGLRKLLEAKDCFVRAALAASDDEEHAGP